MTLQQMMSIVINDPELFELYCRELEERKIVWSKHGCKIAGKKVGIQDYDNARKYAAQAVYLNTNPSINT